MCRRAGIPGHHQVRRRAGVEVCGVVALVDGDAGGGEARRHGRVGRGVAPAHGDAGRGEQLGERAHALATDADEVNVPDRLGRRQRRAVEHAEGGVGEVFQLAHPGSYVGPGVAGRLAVGTAILTRWRRFSDGPAPPRPRASHR